jgi:DNA repair exonuclease SbcCD ATPase subunit
MQKRLGVADQVRGAYDAQITRLGTILKLTNNISDADLKRKEAEAAKARNREESAAIQTERDADAKKRAIANRGEQLSKDLSRIQNETARAQIGVRMAKGGEAAEIDAGISGTDRQIAAVNGAIVDLQAELTATESSLETLRESNAQAFGEALQKVDDLKKAIPDLQGELDRLNTQRMEESFRRSQASIDKTGQALRLAVPQGVDSVSAAATAGMRGDKATLARLGMRGVEMAAPVAMRRDMDAPAARNSQASQDIATNTRETVKILARVRDLIERQEAQGTYVPVF